MGIVRIYFAIVAFTWLNFYLKGKALSAMRAIFIKKTSMKSLYNLFAKA
jgi:hypothetical protein